MALWQHDYWLVPAGDTTDHEWLSPWPIERRGALDTALRARWPETKSFGGIVILGPEDGSRVDLVYADGTTDLVEAFARISLYSDPTPFVEPLCTICWEFGLVFRSFNGRPVHTDPVPAKILDELRRCRAAQFVKDPHGYIERYGSWG